MVSKAFDDDRSPGKEAAQRQRRDTSGCGHSRQAIEPLPQRLIGSPHGADVAVLGAGHRELEREHAARVEPWRHPLELTEAAHQKAGAHQHHDRECELCCDERAATAAAARCSRRSAARFLERPDQIDAAHTQCRREAEQHTGHDAEDQRERQHLAIDRDVMQTWNARRLQQLNRAHRDGRQHDTESTAEQREEHALGE